MTLSHEHAVREVEPNVLGGLEVARMLNSPARTPGSTLSASAVSISR